jgi:hypothetical protein
MAICLFEETIDRLDPTSLLGGQPLKKINLRHPDPDSMVFLKPSHAGTPEWTRIVDGFADLSGQDTSTASSGAILFFNINKRIIACCFGTSVANIHRDNIVPDFGLAVAYHRIPLMQTAVSAQLLKSDLKLKTWIKQESKKFRGGNIFLNRKGEYKAPPISYVITLMTGSAVKSLTDQLPFFSLITFNMIIRKISFDFDIKICQV